LLNQERVDGWLDEFVRRMQENFGERLVFVGHHGSWARGEARPDSDIDTMVVLEEVGTEESQAYRDIIRDMTRGGEAVSGLLLSAGEMGAWPGAMRLQFFYGCQVLHGGLEGIAQPPSRRELLDQARRCAAYNLFNARHYLLYPHDLGAKVGKTVCMFKECLFALQGFLLAETGTFYGRKEDLLEAVTEPEDRAVVEIVRDWSSSAADRAARPEWYFRQLERWCSRMVVRAAEAMAGLGSEAN
jgi:hypothetical protein